MKLPNLENWSSGEPKFDLQGQFSMSKIILIFPNFFFIEECHFRGTFFVNDIFGKLQFLKHFTF